MSSNISSLNLASLDFNAINEDLKNYFKSQEKWQDYNFDTEGSATSLIMDILSAVTYKQNVYLNAALNETFLSTAKTRDAVVRKAKMSNYRIRSVTAATATVKLTFDTNGSYPAQIAIPRYTNFIARDSNGNTFNFVTDKVYYCTPDNDYNYSIEIELVQGEHIENTLEVIANQKIFTIPNRGVDTNRMSVQVKNNSSETNWTNYTESKNIINLTEDSCVYFIQEGSNELFEFYFGDDVHGKAIQDGNIIKISYISSDGRSANDLNIFELSDSLEFDCSIETVSPSANGANLESISSIKRYAPKYMASQNRAVNSGDFEAIIYTNCPQIDSISCWGGEENVPAKYGKVCISAITTSNYSLSDTLKQKVEDLFNNNTIIGSKQLYWVDPQTIHISSNIQIFYDRTTSLSQSDMEMIVRYGLSIYNQYIRGFNYTLDMSNFTSYLKSLNTAFNDVIISNNLQYQISNFNNLQNISIDFQNSLRENTLTSNRYFNGENILCYLSDNGQGIINEYTNNNGVNVINKSNVGTIKYSTGELVINDISVNSILGGNTLNLTVSPNSSKITSKHNIILNLDQDSAVITMVA